MVLLLMCFHWLINNVVSSFVKTNFSVGQSPPLCILLLMSDWCLKRSTTSACQVSLYVLQPWVCAYRTWMGPFRETGRNCFSFCPSTGNPLLMTMQTPATAWWTCWRRFTQREMTRWREPSTKPGQSPKRKKSEERAWWTSEMHSLLFHSRTGWKPPGTQLTRLEY